MAWISGLADKAENILNKIDQNAASALVVPANGSSPATSNKLNVMRKSLSSSTQSLRATLSPSKSSRLSLEGAFGSNGTSSARSESYITSGMADSLESTRSVENTENAISRRSSVSSKAEDIVIDLGISPDESSGTGYQKNAISSIENQELAAFKIALSEVASERDELRLQLSGLNRNVENAGLKQRVDEVEGLLQRLTEEHEKTLHELQISQTASSSYVHSISELETNLAKLQQEYMEVVQKLQMQMKESEHRRNELTQYRSKAQRALQLKDNLIAELRDNATTSAGFGATSPDNNEVTLQSEFEALKQKFDNTMSENRFLAQQLEDMRFAMESLNREHTSKLNAMQTEEEALRNELRSERERCIASESEQRVVSQELQTLRQQFSNQMAASATRLQKKEQQIQQLREGKTFTTQGADNTMGDFNAQLKTLTQTLVNKQNALEIITAERNALRIQLEKVQDQLQKTVYTNDLIRSAPRNAVLSNSTDDVKAQFPLLLRENPFDNRVARRMKRAYSSLDSAGIRLGAFLRRYPLMRISVLMYVALLHIWVVFVLLSYTP